MPSCRSEIWTYDGENNSNLNSFVRCGMDALYHQTNALVQQTQETFKTLEGHAANRDQVENEIQEKINTIVSNCERLDLMVMKLPAFQRPNAKMRCDQLKYDKKHLQAALLAEQQKRMRQETARLEREQLLSRRFAPNPDATTVDLDYAVQHQGAMHRAHRGLDEMLNTGAVALESLKNQRFTLKGAHRRIVDMANTLGLSTHTMRLIERRAVKDKYILVGGMLVTVAVIVLVIMYLT